MNVDRFKANAERFGTPDVSGTPPGATAPTQRLVAFGKSSSRKTRRTVDLTPTQHRALDIWQREAADRLGVARVTGQDVLTALIDQLLTDRELSARVMRSIQARK